LFQTTDIDAGGIQSLDYTIGPAGNVTVITNNLDSSRNQSFGYDDLYRLTGATGIYGSISHTYDNVSNRLTKTIGGQTDTYSYFPGTNKLNEITGANPLTFGYDANGNTTGMGARTLNYNLDNRLIQVVEGTVLADYVYNGLGQRIKRIVNETTTVYHYDRVGNLIGESDASGNFGNKYVYLDENRLIYIGPSEDVYYFVNDHLGTPQKIMDGSSIVVWSADYQPFGEANITVSTVLSNFRLPGQYYDQETGLHYNYFRYYNPQTGRYVTTDPIGLAGGINLFAYVQNNPINIVDAFGLEWTDWQEVIGTIEGTTAIGLKSTTSYGFVTDRDLFVALPSEGIQGARIEVKYGYITIEVPVGDVGPWNGGHTISGKSLNDPYWINNDRPQAECGTDLRGRTSKNRAGIDISASLARFLGLKGTTTIRWRGLPYAGEVYPTNTSIIDP